MNDFPQARCLIGPVRCASLLVKMYKYIEQCNSSR